jgi:hypothetical protein
MPRKWTYAVTFESDIHPPETIRGEVEGSLRAATSRAVRQAKTQKPTQHHIESVVVLIQKYHRS